MKSAESAPYSVERCKSLAIEVNSLCPSCKFQDNHPLKFRVKLDSSSKTTPLEVLKCTNCSSYFFYPVVVADYNEALSESFVEYYVQETAGIQCMLEFLIRIPESHGQRLLDIGTGYGFMLDLWRYHFKAKAWGIEPSVYGETGRCDLKVDIQKTILKEGMDPAGDGKKFRVVSSIEVIEHVEDVAGFIQMAKSFLDEDGILLLTTPNPALLEDEASSDHMIWQTLSPYFHTVILSPEAFKDQLKQAGFSDIQTFSTFHQQVFYASRKPMKLRHWSSEKMTGVYESYLKNLQKRAASLSPLYFGAVTRLLETQVNLGRFADAVTTQSELEANLRKEYYFYRIPPGEASRWHEKIWRDRSYLKAIPLRAVTLQYFRGMTALLYKKDEDLAIEHFEAGITMAPRFLKLIPTAGFQVLPILARMRWQVATLLSRRTGAARTQGLKALKRLRSDEYETDPFWRERASIDRLKALLDYGRHREAIDEIHWLEDWWQEGPLALPQVVEDPSVAAKMLRGETHHERRIHYLWYLNARGQVAKSLQESPDLQALQFRHWEDAQLAYKVLVQESADLIEKETLKDFGWMFYPTACYALGHTYRAQQDARQARASWIQLGDKLQDGPLQTKAAWLPIVEQALIDVPEPPLQEQAVEARPSFYEMLPVKPELNEERPIEEDTDLDKRSQSWYHFDTSYHLQIEQTWSDDGHVCMRGFLVTQDGNPQESELTWNGQAPDEIAWCSRPDLTDCFPHFPKQDSCGFVMIFRRRAKYEVNLKIGSNLPIPLKFPATGFTAKAPVIPSKFEFKDFIQMVNEECQSVMEIGSRLVSPGALSYRAAFSPHVKYTGFDYHPDENTDVVGDAHRLSTYFPEGQTFDAIYSSAVLEHTHAPWKIVLEINKMLPVGGLTYHMVPFTFPLHEMPWDFWRFTHQALKSLFSKMTGFEILHITMQHPCYVHPAKVSAHYMMTPMFESFMSSIIVARKIAPVDDSVFRWDAGALDILPDEGVYPKRT